MAYGDQQEQDFGMGGPGFGLGPDVRAGPDLAPGYDVSTDYAGGATGGPEEAFSATDAIGTMADVLDEAANAVSSGSQDFQTAGPVAAGIQDTQANVMPMGGGTGPDTTPDLGPNPTLDQLQSVINSAGQDTQANVMPGGADVVADLMGAEAGAVDEGTAGEQAATFLSDFQSNRPGSMSAGLNVTEETMSLEDQVSELRSQASELRTLAKGLLSVQKGYPNPNMNISDYDAYSRSPAAWQNPNTAYTPLESPNYPAWQNPNTVRPPLESPNYPAWQNPNTVRPPLEGANFPPDWYNVNEQRAYPTAMGGNLPPISAQEAAATATGGGAGWVDPNASFEDLEAQFSTSPQVSPQVGGGAGWINPNEIQEAFPQGVQDAPIGSVAYPTAMGGNLPISAEQAAATASGGAQGWINPNITEQQAATTLAPKYTGQQYQTHNEMYPNHRSYAAMAGVASIKAQFDGTHKAWIGLINKDMKDRNIELTHEINGQKTGKHSSADWKQYEALFDSKTGLDKNGVPMPGTDKQAQAGMGGVLQGLWGGILSGAEKFFQPSTSSGVVGEPLLETGANTFGADRVEPVQSPRTEGDGPGGMHEEANSLRGTYSWAANLPQQVLLNAVRYGDYLRLLIEYDATGKELPLTVPTWILEGTDRPAEDDEEGANPASWVANHPAMKTQELWAT